MEEKLFDYLDWVELEIEMDVKELAEKVCFTIKDLNDIPLDIEETDMIDLTVEEGTEFDRSGIIYPGPYEVTPRIQKQTLPTENKKMKADVLVKEIPAAKVSNQFGTTMIIGGI